jgi:hypothetical protein
MLLGNCVIVQGRIGSPNFSGIFFQGARKKKGQKGQSEVQNSSADEKKGNK